jgi:rhodanese-related sulfurtransferase
MDETRTDKFLKQMDNKFKMITRDELLKTLKQDDVGVLDVRDPKAYATCHIQNSINIPLSDLPSLIDRLDPNQTVVAVCNGSIQSAYAIYYLYINGFEHVLNLSGGISGCIINNFPLMEVQNT